MLFLVSFRDPGTPDSIDGGKGGGLCCSSAGPRIADAERYGELAAQKATQKVPGPCSLVNGPTPPLRERMIGCVHGRETDLTESIRASQSLIRLKLAQSRVLVRKGLELAHGKCVN